MEDQSLSRQRIFKVILVGGQAVGKSSLINRFVEGNFKEEYFATIGIDFKMHNVTVGQQQVKLQIWDTAGQERFQSLTAGHFKGSHGCICVLDITKDESVQSARYYLEQSLDHYGLERNAVILVANKTDLQQNRTVPQSTINDLADMFGITCMSVSARDGTNINKLFQDLTLRMLQNNSGGMNQSLMENNPIIQFENERGRSCKC